MLTESQQCLGSRLSKLVGGLGSGGGGERKSQASGDSAAGVGQSSAEQEQNKDIAMTTVKMWLVLALKQVVDFDKMK